MSKSKRFGAVFDPDHLCVIVISICSNLAYLKQASNTDDCRVFVSLKCTYTHRQHLTSLYQLVKPRKTKKRNRTDVTSNWTSVVKKGAFS